MDEITTKILSVRGVSKKDVLSKKFNLYLGISLGNKWFTREHIKSYILWALQHTKSRVGIQIADSIHAINIEVRNRKSKEKALKLALEKGEEIEKIVKAIILELPENQQKKIDIVRWADVEKQIPKKIKNTIYEEYRRNKYFRTALLDIVSKHVKGEKRTFSEQDKLRLTEYLLEEVPELLNGFTYKKTHYNTWIYPYDGDLQQLIEDIQLRKRFKSLHNKTTIKKNGLIVLEVT